MWVECNLLAAPLLLGHVAQLWLVDMLPPLQLSPCLLASGNPHNNNITPSLHVFCCVPQVCMETLLSPLTTNNK